MYVLVAKILAPVVVFCTTVVSEWSRLRDASTRRQAIRRVTMGTEGIGVRFVTLVNGKDSTDNVVNIERACEFLSQNGWSTMHACDTAYALREFSEKFIQFRDDERMD